MATSSKVKFNLATLKEKALESLDFEIEQARLNVASHEDPTALEARTDQWRADQEKRVSDLFRQLGDGGVSDRQLAEFRIAPMPEVSYHERRRAESRLRDLESLRSQVSAKADSLVADEEGSISLTKTQLAEFFGL